MKNQHAPVGDVQGAQAELSESQEQNSIPKKSEWADLLSGANAMRALVLAGGVVLHAVNVYIATTILPTVVQDIGGLDLYAWNTTLFVVASILGSALSPKLLEVTGPKGSYGLAAFIFAVGAVICAAAPSMSILLFGRFVQGIGGGFLFALAYAMIRIVFEEPLWPRAMALVSAMWGVATLLGPAVGGVFAQWGMWRAAFWSVALIAIVFAVLASGVLPKRERQTGVAAKGAIPLVQLTLLTLSVLAISAGSASSELIQNVLGLVLALVLAVVLIAVERRSHNKLLPSGAFQFRSAIAALYALMSLLVLTVTSGEVFAPLFLQVLHQQSPLIAGYLAALMGAGWTVGAIISSGLLSDSAIKRAILAGPVLGFLGMVGLVILIPTSSSGLWFDLVPICLALAMIGLGVGLAWPHLLTRVLKSVAPEEQELAGASITTIQLFATAAGAALAGMIANAGGLIDPGGVEGTSRAAYYLFGCFLLAPLVGIIVARNCRV